MGLGNKIALSSSSETVLMVNPENHRAYVIIDETGTSFPGRPVSNAPKRTQFVMRNMTAAAADVGHSTATNNNFNGATDGYPIALTAGTQYAENGSSTLSVFEKVHTGGQTARVGVYTEYNGQHQSGTAVTGAIAAPPISLPALNVLSYGSATAYPCGVSQDRKTVYGTPLNSPSLYKSTDDCATWVLVQTFTGEIVQGFVETDDGEGVLQTINGAAAPGYLYKTSNSRTTFTKVFTTASAASFNSAWSATHFCSFGRNSIAPGTGKYGIIAEYGNQLNSATPDPTKPTHFYLTQDYGATYALVLDLQARYPGLFPMHCHAAAFDSYRGWLWVTFGDTMFEDSNHTSILYSQDLGQTWTSLALPTEWQGQGNPWQSTSIGVFRNCVILGSDNAPGWRRVPFISYRTMGTPVESAIIADHTGGQMIAENIWKGEGLDEVFMTNFNNTTGLQRVPRIMYSPDAGRTVTELWRDDAGTNGSSTGFCCKTANGVVCAAATIAGSPMLLRGTIAQSSGQSDLYANVTGDGSTTAFVFPHYLSPAPTTLRCFPQNAAAVGATPTLSADGTNITLTFASAPTNATVYAYALRFA